MQSRISAISSSARDESAHDVQACTAAKQRSIPSTTSFRSKATWAGDASSISRVEVIASTAPVALFLLNRALGQRERLKARVRDRLATLHGESVGSRPQSLFGAL